MAEWKVPAVGLLVIGAGTVGLLKLAKPHPATFILHDHREGDCRLGSVKEWKATRRHWQECSRHVRIEERCTEGNCPGAVLETILGTSKETSCERGHIQWRVNPSIHCETCEEEAVTCCELGPAGVIDALGRLGRVVPNWYLERILKSGQKRSYQET